MVIHCGCKQLRQDELYGPGMRVANRVNGSKSVLLTVRCTACGLDIVTGKPNKKIAKTGGGSGKNRFTFETAEHLRKRFAKSHGFG